MQLAPDLFFDGTCQQALTYGTVLGGAITALNRYGEAPMAEQMPADMRDRVMHATCAAPGVTFMASDGSDVVGQMQRVSLSLATSDVADGARVFAALADGGTITMPYEKPFWGASFGSLVDRFGVRRMINAG